MIRVLQVIGRMNRAGAETMIMNIYRNIDRTRVQFDFLVFTDNEADYDREIEALGGRIYRMPAFKGYNYMALYRKFQQFFKEHPYKVVHGHIGSLAPAYLKFAKKEGAYAVAHSHCTNSNILSERILYTMLACPVRYVADYFFACSEEAGIDRFGKRVVHSFKFEIVKNAIESRKFVYSEERHRSLKEKFGLRDKIVLGHVGRFAAQKNHSFVIDIFREICKENQEFVLVLVGEGEERPAIEKKIADEGLTEKVILMGVREDIPDMMNLFDAFLFPSKYEGLGNVGIEAQAAGLPCFFSSTIPDEAVVTSNVWKYSLDDGAKKWKDNILKVMQEYQRKDTYNDIVNAGFDVVHTAKQMEEFYIAHAI